MNVCKKHKLLLVLIFTLVITFFVGCASNNTDTKSETQSNETTAAPAANDYDIDFTASYNPDTKHVETVLTNNTENNALLLGRRYTLYKKNGDELKNVTPTYADLFTLSMLFPDKGENTFTYSYPMYNVAVAEEEPMDFESEFENAKIEKGTYVIVITADVADPTVYTTVPSEAVNSKNKNMKAVNTEKSNLVNIELKAEFTV